VHTAAGHLNLFILKVAAGEGFFPAFSSLDNSGWSPRRLLEHHLSSWRIAETVPLAVSAPQHGIMPSWCRLPIAGSSDPFTDAALEVCDEAAGDGGVMIPAHAVLLAMISKEWSRELLQAWKPGGAPAVLIVDPQSCRSQEVVKFVLNCVYTGDVECSFQSNGRLLFQLLCLCERYRLPAFLSHFAQRSLLQCLDDPLSGAVIPHLLRDGKELKLSPPVRQFVARHFIRQDAAWHATDVDDQSVLLSQAISELEPCFAQRAQEEALADPNGMETSMMSIKNGMEASMRATVPSSRRDEGPMSESSIMAAMGAMMNRSAGSEGSLAQRSAGSAQ